ncbi:hypothetical protein HK405_001075, partial [Cladochytrium tenue]
MDVSEGGADSVRRAGRGDVAPAPPAAPPLPTSAPASPSAAPPEGYSNLKSEPIGDTARPSPKMGGRLSSDVVAGICRYIAETAPPPTPNAAAPSKKDEILRPRRAPLSAAALLFECALVSRAWAAVAVPAMWRTVTLPDAATVATFINLSRFSINWSHLANLVEFPPVHSTSRSPTSSAVQSMVESMSSITAQSSEKSADLFEKMLTAMNAGAPLNLNWGACLTAFANAASATGSDDNAGANAAAKINPPTLDPKLLLARFIAYLRQACPELVHQLEVMNHQSLPGGATEPLSGPKNRLPAFAAAAHGPGR